MKEARHKRSHRIGFYLFEMSKMSTATGSESRLDPGTHQGWGKREKGVTHDGYNFTFRVCYLSAEAAITK
jgi:hypothetical protein